MGQYPRVTAFTSKSYSHLPIDCVKGEYETQLLGGKYNCAAKIQNKKTKTGHTVPSGGKNRYSLSHFELPAHAISANTDRHY